MKKHMGNRKYMKNTTYKTVITRLSSRLRAAAVAAVALLVVALLAAGCSSKPAPVANPPDTQSPPAQTETAGVPTDNSPTQPTSQSPSPDSSSQDASAEDRSNMLELGAYYCLNGDPYSFALVFHDDGEVWSTDYDVFTYDIDENAVIIMHLDEETDVLLAIVDEYTLEEETQNQLYIREGGEGFGSSGSSSGMSDAIFHEHYYYLDGADDNTGYYFYDDGVVDVGTPEEWVTCTYTIDNGELTIRSDNTTIAVLLIVNAAVLEDTETGDEFTLTGARANILSVFDWYYLDGDEFSDALRFYADGSVEFRSIYGETDSAEYSLDENTLSLNLGGETQIVYIMNSYMLEFEGGMLFIRLP